MFQFTDFPSLWLFDSSQDFRVLTLKGFPIRNSRDQRVLAPTPSLSQLYTSFIGCQYQGIHRKLFVALPEQYIIWNLSYCINFGVVNLSCSCGYLACFRFCYRSRSKARLSYVAIVQLQRFALRKSLGSLGSRILHWLSSLRVIQNLLTYLSIY